MDRLDAMKLFTRVVEAGSLTAVAHETDVSQPTVSKRLAALEAHLGVQLVHRNARSLRLTEAGQTFYDASIRILGDVDQIESEIRHGQNKLFGSLTVTVSAGFGRLHVIPLLPAFQAKYPDIVLDIVVSDRYVDLVEEGIDVALRIGDLSDSSLKARLIGSSPLPRLCLPNRYPLPHHPRLRAVFYLRTFRITILRKDLSRMLSCLHPRPGMKMISLLTKPLLKFLSIRQIHSAPGSIL